jgi:zinc-ribbon domain
MALTCARCGAQNPDGNQFCQACGTPLMAAVAPPAAPAWIAAPPPSAAPPAQEQPPPAQAPAWSAAPPQGPPSAPGSTAPPLAYASPPPASVAYASPYYAPTAAFPQAPVHRTPWILILAAIFGLIVLMAGCGTAIALFNNGKVSVTGGITSDVPSPTPAGSPSPVTSPSALTGPSASNTGLTLPVPPGWVVDSKDNEQITLADPSGAGVITVGSGASNPAMTAQQQKDGVDQVFTSKYPDTKNCPNTKTTTGSLNGPQGIFWTICFTLTSGSQSFPAAASMFVGTNADGSVFYGVILLSRQDNLQNFVTEAAPVLKGIQWKLK